MGAKSSDNIINRNKVPATSACAGIPLPMRIIYFLIAFFSLIREVLAFPHGGGTPLNIITLPSAGLQAIYSTVHYQGWSGSAIRVQRASDNTQQDIGFVNGLLDISSALSFCGGSACSVVTLYDQSGNGRDATQVAATAPNIASANTINGIPSITFWGGVMTLPNTISVNSQSATVFDVVSLTASPGSSNLYELNTAFASGLTIVLDPSNDEVLDNANFRGTGLYSLSQPEVNVLTSSASSKTYQYNQHLATGIAASSSTTMTGGTLFYMSDTAYKGYGELYLFAVYNTVMGQTAIQSNKNSLYGIFNIQTALNSRVIFDGDSITFGQGSTNGINLTRQVQPLLKEKTYIRNIGVSGQSQGTSYSNITSRIINSYEAGLAKNIVVLEDGEVEICAGTTGSNLFNNTTKNYVSAAQGAGYSVVLATFIYDGNCPSTDTERQNYNTLVRNNAVSLGYSVADYDSITQLQNPQAPGYSSDGIHPTTLGYGAEAQVLYPVLNSLLP